MLLTSWIRALRQSFTRHRMSRARRKQVDARRQTSRHARLAEVLEERSLLSIRPLVIDINAVTGTNVFTSTASTPGISITNSLLDPNNDGISDYDDLLIGVSQSSTFESTVISGAGIGIRINLSNLTGLNHIAIDNVFITAGASQQGISITLDNVALQSLAIDQTNVTPAATGTGGVGLDINLKNMASTTGLDVSVQNSNIRSGSSSLNGVNITLESVSKATHVGELTLSDSTVEGYGVSTSANSTLYATIDQASVRNSRIQDGAANPVARGITYTLNRTTVGDLRIEDNLRLRNVAVTTTDSPLHTVSISDNPNFNVSSFVATDTIRDAIRINATSTNAFGTQRSDVTNLRIVNNTITGSLANANSVNGIVLNLSDSNLGDYAIPYAGARIAGNTISNLSGGINSPATAISVVASATANFVAANGGRPLLLDFDGDGTANDTNAITQNTLLSNNGRGLVVTGNPDTTFLADVTNNTIDGGAAPNRREGVTVTVAVKPTLASADSFSLNFSDNVVNRSQGSALSISMQDSSIGDFVARNNEFTNSTAFPFVSTLTATTPNGLSLVLEGTNTNQEAANLLKSSVIEGNYIGITRPTTLNPNGVAGPNAGNGIFINTQEASEIRDLQILNNVVRNNNSNDTQAGLLFLREDKSVLRSTNSANRAVIVEGNTIGNNRNGVVLDARNGSIDLLDFDLHDNFIGTDATGADLGNTSDGLSLIVQADARLLVDLDNNQIRFNSLNGIHVSDVVGNFASDKRQVGGTWINNTISDNTQNGILITGRHGLSDESTGVKTPLVIGLEGQGNDIENNGGNGIRIYGPLVGTNNSRQSTATGEVAITNNLIHANSGGGLGNIVQSNAGIFVRSSSEKLDIRHNQIEGNTGKGIDLEVVHGIATQPTNNGEPGDIEATIRDNVITGQISGQNITVDNGDGIELSNFELDISRIGQLSNNARLNRMDVLALNNFIDSNEGRGVDVLNIGNGTMQVRFGDNTNQGRNTIVGNLLDGFRVINTIDDSQPQDGVPINNGNANQFPNLGTPVPVTDARRVLYSPDMMLDVAKNTIRDNGISMPVPRQYGGISDVNGTGLVVLASGTGNGLDILFGGENQFAATFPNEVGNGSGNPVAGNGRVNLRVTDNQFEGNFGNDFSVIPFIAAIPPQTQTSGDNGSWPVPPGSFFISAMWLDPLVRINAVVSGNTGNGLDVVRPAPDYLNDEQWFKSRQTRGQGPFASGTRPRNATRLASDGSPFDPTPGNSFVYPGVDEGFISRQTGNNSLSAQPTTLRVEAGFDRSGTTTGFPFSDPNAVGPGSEDNFDDPVTVITNGRVDTIWDTVSVGSFTYPNVDSPTNLTVSVLGVGSTLSSTPGVVTFNFSEYVRFVDISDFRLLRNGVVVPLESAPGVPLPVSPVLASQDPNNPGAFSRFNINLTSVTSISGNYELQVLAVDPSNPTFTPIRDIHLQLSNQGNTLVRVIDGDGVLQDYALNNAFQVDTARPVATISPVTPDPRNSAAGIVTVNFNEDVTGIDIADFELRRNDGVSTQLVLLGSIGVVQVSPSQYTLNLNQLSGAPGTYELRLISTDLNTPVRDLAGNLVSENVAPGIAASDTWFVDTTLPFVTSIADSLFTTFIVSPVNAHPASVLVNFSEAVSGVDNSDFTLLRTNTDGTISKIDISSSVTFPLFQLTASRYELNLSALATTAGTYSLTINPLNSGIVDTAGNAFLTSFSASWVLDVAAPLADIVDVAPDPRQTPVDALNTLFTEKVNGVNLLNAAAQYVLSVDDGTTATAGSISDATNSGPIVVTATGHGLANGDRITIYGVAGNTNTNGVFIVQNVVPGVSFELTGSSGNGIYSGGGRWVRTVSLAGLTVSKQTDTRYVLNLSSVTLNQGTYIVSLLANGTITDDAGNAVGPATGQFNVAAQDIWTNGPDAAPTGTITPITTPRGTNAGIVTITFSEPLDKINGNSPVDFKDFKLTRGLTTISLASVPITQTGPMTYTLDLSGAGLTDIDGSYTLQLLNTDTVGASATPLKDLTGNLLSDDSDPGTPAGVASQITWAKDGTLSGPQVTTFLDVQRGNALGSITKLREVQTLEINFTENVQGIDLTDASKNFLLTRQATGGVAIPVSLDGIAVQQVTPKQYRINLSTLTGTDGKYRFTVLANGLIKNFAPVPVELKNPQTVTWTKDGIMRPSTVGDSTDSIQGNEVVGSGGSYSLRQAIQEANALAGDDVIELGAGTFLLSLAGVQEDFAAVGDLDIRQNLVIRGKGVGVTIIDATALANQLTTTNRDRLFQILAGATVTIQGVTIQKGAVTGSEDGGAIRNAGTLTILDSLIQNSTSQDDAGAINNTGTLTIDRTTISGNTSVATGGAIRNAGTLFLNNSTLSNNLTTSASGHGGALMNVATFSATLEGVTISGNTALNAAGGGIRNDGTLRLINDTIAFNKSLTAGAGISRNLGTVTIGNTIVSDNTLTNAAATPSDVAGIFVSIGGNLIRTLGTAVGFIGTDQLNVNPNLLPLANNGGPTQTHAFLQNSPAIDRGLNANVTDQNVNTSLDQRGALRFLDGPALNRNAVDVGAIEFGTFFVNTTDDSLDVNPGDGLAEDGLRQTSLRAAVMESNLLPGESAIILDGKVYSLKRLAPDTTAPTVASITGVPLAPITTGGVGVVTITFSERVAGVDLSDIVLTRTVGGVVTPITLLASVFQITKVSDLVYKIENKADITNNVVNTGLTSITQTNGLYNLTLLTTSPTAFDANGLPLRIRDIEDNTLKASENVNWVRGIDTFAPTVTITANSAVVAGGFSDFITNGGTVTVTFSEKVTGVSANNFTLTRNGTAVTGLVVTPTTDNNFGGRTVVSLNLQTLSAANGVYVLTLNPNVGVNVTIKDSANNNLAAGGSISWTKNADLRIEPINNPRVDEVTKLRLQFTERVAGVKLDDFTLTFDDGSGIGPQPVNLSQATLTTVGAVTAVPNFGNAAEQWELTLSNKQAARDGVYQLSFDGLTNGNQLVTTATTAVITVPFAPTATTLPFRIGEDASAIGDLDIVLGAGRVQIFGKGKDDSTTVLGNPQARTVIDGNLTDRLFDLTVGANVAISGVEMINGKVVYERSGGSFRNFGSLTLNDDDLLSSFADGNGGAIYNAAPFGLQVAVSDSLRLAALATDAVLTLNSIALFPNTAPFIVLIDSEQIQVTAVNPANNTFTVSRGYNGTTATGHAAGSPVTLLSLTTINRSNLQNNLAGSATSGSQFGKGGAIFNENGAVTINEGTYSGNGAVTDGGAIYNGNQATAALLSTTFTSNLSGRDGGAVYNNDTAILTISSSTLSNNRADATVNGIINDLNGDGGAIYNETSSTLVLDDSLLQNNSARNGGALYNDDGTLVLNRDTFGVNFALENGGAIFNTSGGRLTLNQGLFTTNSASDNGGAIQNYGNLVVLDVAGTGTQFLSNEAGTDIRPGDANNGVGGAIFNQDGVVDISSATFTLNRSHGDAGVIFNDGDGTLKIRRTTFDRNSAEGNGGVLVNDDFAQLTIDEATFSNNTATGDGGAIYNNSSFTSGSTLSLTIDDTTLNSNTAAHGGAIFNGPSGGLTMTNSTLSANVATINGGGLANFGTATLLNVTLYLNDAPVGAGIANNIGGTPPFGPATLKNTLVAGGTLSADIAGANFVDGGHNLIGNIGAVTAFGTVAAPQNGNLLGDSLTEINPQLDTLRDNGGPTLTHALLFGSPARDAGDNFAVTLNDQRGLNRVFDGDGNGVATVDIGAFESGFVVNSFLDTVDENPGDGINADANGRSTLRAAIMEANARPGEDTIILGPGIFKLTLAGRAEDFRLNAAGNITSSSETGDLDILDDLNIIGAGTDLTFIDAAQIDRLFQVFPNVNLKLSNLTLQNGNATSTDFGGAIFNQGETTLDNVLVINSSAGRGGGIYNDTTGTLTIEDSLFRGNQAVQQGGALYNDGTLTLTRSDIGAVSRLAASVASKVATTITVSDVSDFPASGPFVVQVDSERMLVTAVLGNQFTVTRGYNGTVATTHSSSAFATLGNVANIHGGGLYNLGIADITQSSFSGNLAQSRGGGLYNAALTGALTANLNAVQTTFALTTVVGFPTVGTFTIQVDSEKMTVTNVNPATNQITVTRGVAGTVAAVHSAGVFATSVGVNQTTIEQSTFVDNFASSRGAAIYNEEELTIKNSTISNNDSGTNAALGNSVSGQVTIDNSTVVDNVAYRGGGLANSLIGTVTVHNTILANNSSTSITGAKAPNVRGTFATLGNNFVGNNADSLGFVNNTNFDQVGSGTSPFDPVLKTLTDNGGPTQTHAARTGSPIIDAGNNTGGDPFDQRGAIRPTNSDSDIGSVEQQEVHVSINDVSLREGNSGSTIFTFTLSLTKPSIQEVRVHYTLQGDTAFAGEDFIDASGDVVFAPNQLNQTLEVIVNGDTTIEPDEQFLVNLSVPTDATFTPTLDRTQAIGTILSDDTGFRITDVNKVEGEAGSPDQDYVFTVAVVGAKLSPNQVVTVNYAIVDGSATIAGGDYALVGAATGTFTFTAGPNGELPAVQTLTVKVKGDEAVEANENFFVNLTSADMPFEFDKAKGVGTIFNDDLGFTISNATANEGDPVSVVPMNFTVTLNRAVYVSGLNGVPTLATTTATVATTSGSATSGQDFNPVNTVLTFSGTTTSQVVTVGIIGDLRYEVPSETFQLQVTAGTINGVSDTNVVAFSTSGTGTIVDNDPPPDQYHIYTRFDAGANHIRVDRIHTVLGVPTRSNILDVLQAGAGPISQVGDFGGSATDDLFAVDFNLYDNSNNFTLYDTTGAIDATHVLGTSNPIPVGGLSVDGQNQVGADAVRFQGGGTFNTVTYNSINSGTGSVNFDGSVVSYTGLEPIFDNTRADNRVFNAPAGVSNDSITASASGGIISISGPTFESVTALAPSSSLTINGDGGNDTIQMNGGFTASLTINAGDGNDNVNLSGWSSTSTINGGTGTDTITGGSNADSIDGGDGNDTITGGLGNDTLLGGLGNDSIVAGGGDDVVNGGDGNDTIQGNDGIDAINGGDGNDSIDGGTGSETVDGGAGDDTVNGGDGDDTVLGGDGNDLLSGGNGNDSVDGGFGDDTMSGDLGNDTVNGQNGSDVFLYVDPTNSNINFTLTATMFTAGSETDLLTNTERANITAGNGNNRIDASTFDGSVTMNGAGGNDTLLGGLGSDSMIGGLGADSATGGNGNDTINGGDGNDTLFGNDGEDVLTGDAGVDLLDGGADNDSVTGGSGNDMLTGGAGIDTLDGGADQDTLTGGDDGDSLLGGAGQDLINGDNGDDTIDGGDGDDTAFGDNGNDDVRGGVGNDTLEGNLGDDSVNGNDGNDTLDGNLGFDTLFGGTGDDSMISSDGNDQVLGQGGSRDTFTFEGDNFLDDVFTITLAGNGNPLVTPTGIGLARLNPGLSFTTILLGVEIFTLNLNGGNDLVTLGDLNGVLDLTVLNINGGDGNDTIDGSLSTSPTVSIRASMGLGDDSVQGTAAPDTIFGDAGNDTIIGNAGNDSILGGVGNDSLNGNDGVDTINGELGDDSIWGGASGDSLIGFDGKDTIWGQGGNDTINGGVGDDSLDGGYGNTLTTGSGNDSIIGGWGNDKIAGRDGADTLFGDISGDTLATGNDTITGGADNDRIDAGNGSDLVEGDAGNDTINGGAGNDFLLGGTGNDSILGGAGNDTLVGEAGNDTVDGQGGTDTVLGGNGLGTDTHTTLDKRIGEKINELFKITTARPSIFNELNF